MTKSFIIWLRTRFNRINRVTSQYGIHLDEILRLRHFVADLLVFIRNRRSYLKLSKLSETGLLFPKAANFPCFGDQRRDGGTIETHYFIQDLYVAQQIFRANPKRHIDVGSRIDGFVAHVASFREIEVGELRPLPLDNQNIKVLRLDITDTETVPKAACDSVSCLHVLEHIGLGRYGDRINPDGWLIASHNLLSMLSLGGTLYVSVPVGSPKVEYDAHRVFSAETLFHAMSPHAQIKEIVLIGDNNEFTNFGSDMVSAANSADEQSYGCLILNLTKIQQPTNVRT